MSSVQLIIAIMICSDMYVRVDVLYSASIYHVYVHRYTVVIAYALDFYGNISAAMNRVCTHQLCTFQSAIHFYTISILFYVFYSLPVMSLHQ